MRAAVRSQAGPLLHGGAPAARQPDNQHRLSLSFYGNAVASEDPAIDQWIHPQIYLADVLHRADFIKEFQVSVLVDTDMGLDDAVLPDPAARDLAFDKLTMPERQHFFDLRNRIDGRPGLVYLVKEIDVGPWDWVDVLFGHDGPVKAWWNGKEVFQGPGTDPAVQDITSLNLASRHGTNQLAIAFDSNGGKAGTLYVRWERAWE